MSGVDVVAVLRRHAVAERDRLGATDNVTQAALAAVAELIASAEAVADEHYGPLVEVKYHGPEDEIGDRVCCGVVETQPHWHDCPAIRLRSAIAVCRGDAE